jgi:hypothetical protein
MRRRLPSDAATALVSTARIKPQAVYLVDVQTAHVREGAYYLEYGHDRS